MEHIAKFVHCQLPPIDEKETDLTKHFLGSVSYRMFRQTESKLTVAITKGW